MRVGRLGRLRWKVGKDFFLEKAAKTFAIAGVRCGNARTKRATVFWFFFSKKNCFLALLICAFFAADDALPPNLSRYRHASTEILAHDGTMLAAMPTERGIWRLRTVRGDVDPRYLDLLIAAEDRHFRAHPGIDPMAMLRAAWQWARAGRIVSGGSTLTMQTARLLEPHPRGLIGKIHDVLRALQLERRYSKDQILDMYLTLAPFGGNIEGVRAASLTWFGHDAQRLSAQEAALLVSLPQAPSRRRPDRHAAVAARAMGRLTRRLFMQGALPDWLPLAPGLPAVGRNALPRLAGFVASRLARHAVAGSRIATTLDADLQRRLEDLLAREMAGEDPKIGVAGMIVDPHARTVLASVGGRGASFPGGALDLTEAVRSPGSALKPFIYSLAFDDGILHPLTLIPDAAGIIDGYAPHNFDYAFHGAITAQTALRQSFNVPAVEVLSRVGAERFVAALRQAGAAITLPGPRASLAVALGGLGISLQDMVALYAALADDGDAALLRVVAGAGGSRTPFLGARGIYYVRQVLLGSPPPPGMAYAVLTGGRDIAFKTGTSYGFRDAWAVGYSAGFVIGIWTGRVDGTPRPGAVGRSAAAPLMLDAFGLLPPEEQAGPQPPPGVLLATRTEDLPPALRRLAGFGPERRRGPVLDFPPNGAALDLLGGPNGGFATVPLHVAGGVAPYRWLINGAPVAGGADRLFWRPDGPGAVSVTVLDAQDRAARSVFDLH
jgi:penicillin-binding protein 1C